MNMGMILLDGAIGTSLLQLIGENLPMWRHNTLHPEMVKSIIKGYIKVGAKIVQANTFPLTFGVVPELEKEVALAVSLAREAVAETGATDVLVALSLGPVDAKKGALEAASLYARAITEGVACGADVVELLTFGDVDMLAVAVREAKRLRAPVMASMSFGMDGKTYGGHDVERIVRTLEPLGVEAMGLNCSFGPVPSLPVLKAFARLTSVPLFFKPNNMRVEGLKKTFTPMEFAEQMEPALEYATYIGGCCGTEAADINALRQKMSASD